MGIREALETVSDLEKNGVVQRYAVCGALAAFYYLEPAATEDIDILVSFEAAGSATGLVTLEPILTALSARGFDKFHKEGILVSDFPVQFVPVADALDREALEDALDVDIPFPAGEVRVRILKAEHLACLALRVGRPKDKIRLAEFLARGSLNLDVMLQLVNRHGLTEKWTAFLKSL